MKRILFFAFVFVLQHLTSQEKFAKEFSFINDNDLYISTVKDRYYTNGMFFTYRFLAKNNNKKLEKKIFELQLGHHMYTPHKAVVSNISQHDRPFAGYLYGSFGINRVYKNNTILNTQVQLGVLGPMSLGYELQEFIHNIYGFEEAVGWKYQIKGAIGLNASADYIDFLGIDDTGFFDATWINNVKFGTIYTDITSGFYLRMGLKPLQKIVNSIAFNTSINNNTTNYNRAVESFLYFKPTFSYVFYDATIQGSILRDDNPVTKELINFVFGFEVGLRFTANRFNFGYGINYQTNKSKGLLKDNGNTYGYIQVNYLIR